MKRGPLGIILLCLSLALSCQAGSVLTVRLVEGLPANTGSPQGLEDVIGALKNTQMAASFRLLDSTTIALPAAAEAHAMGGLTIQCAGEPKNLSITVFKGGKQMLKTTLTLQDKKPFILGGLGGRRGKMVLIFLLR